MNDTERLYLQMAADWADPRGFFYEEEVGERIGLDPALPGLRDELIRTSQALLERGFIVPGDKGRGPGRRGLCLTTEAKNIARKQDPQRLLEAIYALAGGDPSKIVSWRDLASEVGWSPENAEHHSRSLAAAEYLQQANYVTFEVEEGDAYRITARGMDQVEGRAQTIGPPLIQTEREPPPEIQDSLGRFQAEHTDRDRVAFIMMQFKPGKAHEDITEAIRAGLGSHGIVGMRADEKDYHDDMFSNVLTYMYGCGFGIAVF